MSEGMSIPITEFLGPRKPCPFCGNEDLECVEFTVYCKRCEASADSSAWQFRAELGKVEKEFREAVKQIVKDQQAHDITRGELKDAETENERLRKSLITISGSLCRCSNEITGLCLSCIARKAIAPYHTEQP